MLNEILQVLVPGISELIRLHGHTVVSDGTGICYTLGLTLRGLPELVLADAPPEAETVLRDWARACIDGTLVKPPRWSYVDNEDRTHVYKVKPHTASLDLAYAVYPDGYTAMRVYPLSCPCQICGRLVKL